MYTLSGTYSKDKKDLKKYETLLNSSRDIDVVILKLFVHILELSK